jgi:hypothetical protein
MKSWNRQNTEDSERLLCDKIDRYASAQSIPPMV